MNILRLFFSRLENWFAHHSMQHSMGEKLNIERKTSLQHLSNRLLVKRQTKRINFNRESAVRFRNSLEFDGKVKEKVIFSKLVFKI